MTKAIPTYMETEVWEQLLPYDERRDFEVTYIKVADLAFGGGGDWTVCEIGSRGFGAVPKDWTMLAWKANADMLCKEMVRAINAKPGPHREQKPWVPKPVTGFWVPGPMPVLRMRYAEPAHTRTHQIRRDLRNLTTWLKRALVEYERQHGGSVNVS